MPLPGKPIVAQYQWTCVSDNVTSGRFNVPNEVMYSVNIEGCVGIVAFKIIETGEQGVVYNIL